MRHFGQALLGLLLCMLLSLSAMAEVAHPYGEWIIDTQPTCTQPGLRHRTCTAEALPHSEDEVIPALGHEYKESITREPTADKEGEKTFSCIRGDHTYTEPIAKLPVHEHDFQEVSRIDATCEGEGLIAYTCADCDETYGENIPALGHDYGAYTQTLAPSLFAEGEEQAICAHDTKHTLTRHLPRLVTMEVNTADAVMAPANGGIIVSFALTLLSDLSVIFWDMRRRKRGEAEKRTKYHLMILVALLCLWIVGVPLLAKMIFPAMTYFNLLGIVAAAAILPIGIALKWYVRRRVIDLDGDLGVHTANEQYGMLVSVSTAK